eukprot:g4585.t1
MLVTGPQVCWGYDTITGHRYPPHRMWCFAVRWVALLLTQVKSEKTRMDSDIVRGSIDFVMTYFDLLLYALRPKELTIAALDEAAQAAALLHALASHRQTWTFSMPAARQAELLEAARLLIRDLSVAIDPNSTDSSLEFRPISPDERWKERHQRARRRFQRALRKIGLKNMLTKMKKAFRSGPVPTSPSKTSSGSSMKPDLDTKRASFTPAKVRKKSEDSPDEESASQFRKEAQVGLLRVLRHLTSLMRTVTPPGNGVPIFTFSTAHGPTHAPSVGHIISYVHFCIRRSVAMEYRSDDTGLVDEQRKVLAAIIEEGSGLLLCNIHLHLRRYVYSDREKEAVNNFLSKELRLAMREKASWAEWVVQVRDWASEMLKTRKPSTTPGKGERIAIASAGSSGDMSMESIQSLSSRRTCSSIDKRRLWRRRTAVRGGGGRRAYTVLGIETSCDDTAAAVVTSDGQVLSEVISSQWHLNDKYQGIHPMMASREHEKNLPGVVEAVLRDSGLSGADPKSMIDAIAITVGPGLALCLRAGLEAAVDLGRQWKVPIYPVNHLEAHALVPRLFDPSLEFPFLALLASGGHTMLVLAKNHREYDLLGTTRDDAAGEAFDKVARMLNLTKNVAGHGGVALEHAAMRGDPNRCAVALPVPMKQNGKQRKSCDFSFSGLKTAVLYAIRDDETFSSSPTSHEDYAASFQDVVASHIADRTKRALEVCEERHAGAIRNLVVSGGVAANQALRERLGRLGKDCGVRVSYPPLSLCTDNGVMVAWSAIEAHRNGIAPLSEDEFECLEYRPRWPLESVRRAY